MVTRGVSSVRSPVNNLTQLAPNGLDHDSFSGAIISSFRKVYSVPRTEVVQVPGEMIEDTWLALATEVQAYIHTQETDLRSWEWLYGQTPEFTQTLDHSFAWGFVVGR